ncbi:hypothetical protein CRENBAI_011840 [Crenichthys baileyi]|uniref:Uncharacterized protein n=1 Tax=Crenichthys baileyi TaxID=28760 RepID=A0AAV9RK53_9TELE
MDAIHSPSLPIHTLYSRSRYRYPKRGPQTQEVVPFLKGWKQADCPSTSPDYCPNPSDPGPDPEPSFQPQPLSGKGATYKRGVYLGDPQPPTDIEHMPPNPNTINPSPQGHTPADEPHPRKANEDTSTQRKLHTQPPHPHRILSSTTQRATTAMQCHPCLRPQATEQTPPNTVLTMDPLIPHQDRTNSPGQRSLSGSMHLGSAAPIMPPQQKHTTSPPLQPGRNTNQLSSILTAQPIQMLPATPIPSEYDSQRSSTPPNLPNYPANARSPSPGPSPPVHESEICASWVTGLGRPTAPGQAQPASHPSAGTRRAPPLHQPDSDRSPVPSRGPKPQKEVSEKGHHTKQAGQAKPHINHCCTLPGQDPPAD